MHAAQTPRERFLAACRREVQDVPPAWVMRQAGRYLPEYRAVREQHDFLSMCRTPAAAAEVTLQPIRRFGMDAAVIFSDILVPCAAMGQDLRFAEGEGPALAPCVRTAADVERLRDFDAGTATGFLGEAIRLVRKELGKERAIIGFCGAPWTTASYMIEGGTSRNFEHSKRLLLSEPEVFERLCTRLVDNLIPYLAMQVAAGADALQIFDSWGGALDAATYRRALLPHVARLVAGARQLGVPVILYVNGCAQLLEVLADSGADVLGIDWRVAPAEAIARVGSRVALQGNLDPCTLFAPPAVVARELARVLDEFRGQRGYIFNLGSGILPGTPVESMDVLFRGLRGRQERAELAGIAARTLRVSAMAEARELLVKYATSAPRYTSYPTAVDWSKDFEPARYPELLARAAARTGPLSVYVHLPFCAELCLFCGCNMVVSSNVSRIDSYLDALEREFEFVGASGIGRRPVRQYHWGGGTPTQLDLAQIERVQRVFERYFHFSEDAEVGIEVDPRVTSREQVRLLARLGFNRISMGVQDFDPAVQVAIKREQSEAETRAVVDAARECGMGSVNIDLMYGLPHQTESGFADTVERVLRIRPERVALFHYAHVPWLKRHQEALELEALPGSETKLSIFLRAIEQFRAAGYVYIGLDHFALPTDEMALAHRQKNLGRNFMGYTTRRGDDMVSLGVSSIGDVSGCFVQNEPKENEYKAAIARAGHASVRGHELSADDRLRRDVILGLMCNGEVRKQAIEAAHGIRFDATFAAELAELGSLAQDGLVALHPGSIEVTDRGQLFLRNVALPFDRYFVRRRRDGDAKPAFSKTL